jgi:hypothetical protein
MGQCFLNLGMSRFEIEGPGFQSTVQGAECLKRRSLFWRKPEYLDQVHTAFAGKLEAVIENRLDSMSGGCFAASSRHWKSASRYRLSASSGLSWRWRTAYAIILPLAWIVRMCARFVAKVYLKCQFKVSASRQLSSLAEFSLNALQKASNRESKNASSCTSTSFLLALDLNRSHTPNPRPTGKLSASAAGTCFLIRRLRASSLGPVIQKSAFW